MTPRLRTLPKAVEELKAVDPYTCVTLTRLRRWIKEGKIKHINSGSYAFIDMNELEKYLQGV